MATIWHHCKCVMCVIVLILVTRVRSTIPMAPRRYNFQTRRSSTSTQMGRTRSYFPMVQCGNCCLMVTVPSALPMGRSFSQNMIVHTSSECNVVQWVGQTFTNWFIPRPLSICLTHTCAVANQSVTFKTAVVCLWSKHHLNKHCLTIKWVSKGITDYNWMHGSREKNNGKG